MFMGLEVDSWIKTLDVEFPLLQIQFEVKVVDHNSSTK